jgi:hypothetical protein
VSLSFEGFWVRTSQTSIGLAFPSVLCADTPWRFFIGLARDEVLFRRYEEDLQAATGVKLGRAKHGETKVSKKTRKRRQQVQHQQEPSRSPG